MQFVVQYVLYEITESVMAYKMILGYFSSIFLEIITHSPFEGLNTHPPSVIHKANLTGYCS
jgi:hypothetical protein